MAESKMNNLAASTSLSNSPRYMYLHPSTAFPPVRTEEFPSHFPFSINSFFFIFETTTNQATYMHQTYAITEQYIN